MKDYNIKASRVKSLIRRWRAKGVTPGDTMKLMMLYLGIDRFLSHELMVYPKTEFNKMRKDLGFKTITAMLDVIRQSESFIIVHHRSDDGVVAIVSPAFKYNLEYTNDLYVEVAGEDEADTGVANSDETVGKCDKNVGECDTVYLNNVSEDTYKDVSVNTSLDKDKEIITLRLSRSMLKCFTSVRVGKGFVWCHSAAISSMVRPVTSAISSAENPFAFILRALSILASAFPSALASAFAVLMALLISR